MYAKKKAYYEAYTIYQNGRNRSASIETRRLEAGSKVFLLKDNENNSTL